MFPTSEAALATLAAFEKNAPQLPQGRARVTIGTGRSSADGNSHGDINTADCEGRADSAYRKALLALSPTFGGEIEFLPGEYNWARPGVTDRPSVDVISSRRTIHKHWSDDLWGGLYRIKHDYCSWRGGVVRIHRNVANQAVIAATANSAGLETCRDAVVEGTHFDCQVAGDQSFPMMMIYMGYVMRKWVTRNTMFPNKGMSFIRSTLGNRGYINFNSLTNDDYGNISSGGFFPTFRPVAGGIWVDGDEWGQTIGNTMYACGDPLDGGASYLMRHTRGAFPPGTETGHYIVGLNTVEMCPAKRGIQCWGGYSLDYIGNIFGFPFEYCDTDGDGYIHVTGQGGDATGAECFDLSFFGNHIHNLAKNDTDAAFMFLEKCSTVYIGPNKWDIIYCRYPLQVVAETCRRLVMSPGAFHASGSPTPKSRAPILVRKALGNSGAAVIQDGMLISAPFAFSGFNGFSDGVSTPTNGHGYHSLATGGTLNGRGLNNVDTGAAPASGVATDKLTVACKI